MTSAILSKSQKASIASTNQLNLEFWLQFSVDNLNWFEFIVLDVSKSVDFNCSFVWIFRYGANANPTDGGSLPIIALLDKLLDDPYNQIHVEICLKILLKTVPAIEMPYKVDNTKNNHDQNGIDNKILYLSAIHLPISKKDVHSEIRNFIREGMY